MQDLSSLPLYHLPMDQSGFAENPWPEFSAARAQHPWLAQCPFGYVVHEYEAMKDLLWLDASMRTAHEQVVEIMDAKGTPWGRFQEEMILAYSGQDHKRLRDALAPAFTPRQANRHRPLMRAVISDLLDQWAPRGAFDFEEFASFFPITVMCSLIGAPTQMAPELRSSMEALGLSLSMDRAHMPKLQQATEILDAFAHDLVASRRRQDRTVAEPDLLDALLATRAREEITERELTDLLIFLFVAGYDTSKNALTLLMDAMLKRPDDYRRCAADAEFCRAVVEESFRFCTTATIPRLTVAEIDYRDVTVPEGTMLFFPVSVAGRDPIIADAGRFLPERDQVHRHLAFGRGMHLCLGQFIARAQIEEGFHLIAQRIRDPRRTGPSTWRPFFGVWGMRGLPISFTPAAAGPEHEVGASGEGSSL